MIWESTNRNWLSTEQSTNNCRNCLNSIVTNKCPKINYLNIEPRLQILTTMIVNKWSKEDIEFNKKDMKPWKELLEMCTKWMKLLTLLISNSIDKLTNLIVSMITWKIPKPRSKGKTFLTQSLKTSEVFCQTNIYWSIDDLPHCFHSDSDHCYHYFEDYRQNS